ncbi:hypothetical protein L7F22_030348 [Adiantum nelumboides]|nr:hypothetical protein [Adiantum nelumboides]
MATKKYLDADFDEDDDDEEYSSSEEDDGEESNELDDSSDVEVSSLFLEEEKGQKQATLFLMENEETSGSYEQIEGLMQPKVQTNVKDELIQKMLSPDLTSYEKGVYVHMLQQFPNLFITSYEKIRGFKGEEINIPIKEGAQPVRQKLRRMGQVQLNALKKEVDKLLKAGFIYLVSTANWAVIANGPFEKWGIDAMGPLPRTTNGKLYILVAIDYMTRFGTPLEIVSDNGPGFRRGLLTEVCEVLKISHRHSTPYYPQSNGLVEKANGIIAGIIRKMVESRQEQSNDEAWIDRLLNLVELEWKREAAYHCYEKKALQLKDKLNEGIKDKEIKEKSLVLRYNNALDNRFDAKFECRWEGPFIVKKAFTGGYYQLMDLNGKEHPRKVNGYRLKPYLSRILPAVFETKQVSKKTKKICCHCCSDTHQVKSCAFQHVLKEVAKNQKEKLSSPTSCPESSFQYNLVDGT